MVLLLKHTLPSSGLGVGIEIKPEKVTFPGACCQLTSTSKLSSTGTDGSQVRSWLESRKGSKVGYLQSLQGSLKFNDQHESLINFSRALSCGKAAKKGNLKQMPSLLEINMPNKILMTSSYRGIPQCEETQNAKLCKDT